MKDPLRLTKGPLERAISNVRVPLPIILSARKTKIKMLLTGVFLSTIFFVSLSFTATGQPTILWDKTFGGIPIPGSQNDRWGGDRLKSVISTGDGGYLLGGTSSSNINGDKSELCRGANDYWIVKIDAQGNKQWDKTFGGFLEDELSSIVPAPDGGYLLAGTSSSPVSGDKTAPGATDYWAVKVDGQGNKLWDKTFGINDGLDRLSNAIAIPGGGYLLGGTSQTPVGADYFVVRIDNQGNKIWDKPFGGDSDDFLSTVTLTPDGFLLAGFSHSGISGDKSEAGAGTWLVKIDNQGNKVWDKTLGVNIPFSILTPDGGYLLAGGSRVVKTDATGNIVWDKTYGSLEDQFTSIVSVPDGGYLLTGTLLSAVTNQEFWVIKIDNQGNKVWDKTIGGSGSDLATSSVVAPNGNYLVGGYSNSNISGDKSENSKGGFDYWIVALKEPITSPITSLTLMNARTDREIGELKDGDVINLKEVGSKLLDIRANIDAEKITKVVFDLKGPITHHQTEKISPYALFGDHHGHFNGRKWLTGEYTLTVTAYIKDKKTVPLTISFTVTDGFSISGFTLIDATLDQEISTLSDGDVIDLSLLKCDKLSVRGNTQPMHVDKVVFTLQGPIVYFWIERFYPYTLFGDLTSRNGSTDYAGLKLVPGNYTLTATPYSDGVWGASHTIAFVVKNGESLETGGLRVEVFPNPAVGVINIIHRGKSDKAQMSLLDFNGKVLMRQPLSQQPVEQLDVSGFRKGTHYLKIVDPQGSQIIRLVIE